MMTFSDDISKKINEINKMNGDMNDINLTNNSKIDISIIDNYINIMNKRSDLKINKTEIINMLEIIKSSIKDNNIEIIME